MNHNFIKPYYDRLLVEKKLKQIDNLYKDFEIPGAASKVFAWLLVVFFFFFF